MEKLYGRVVGDVPCMDSEKNLGGCTQMVIKMIDNISREILTRTSNFRKCELKLGGRPTTAEGQNHGIDPVKTIIDGKWKYAEARDHSNRAENGPGPAVDQTDSQSTRSS